MDGYPDVHLNCVAADGADMFDDFADVIKACASLDGVSETFRKAVAAHGYTASAGRCFVPTHDGRIAKTLFRNWTREWAALSDQKDFTAKSFVVSEARKRTTSFTWQGILAERRLSSAEQDVLDSARAWGWNNGFVLPVHGAGGYFAVISMASPERDLDLSETRLTNLKMIGMLAHERCCALAGVGTSNGLTEALSPRELECMRWVADGKTDAEIGGILSISEATVKFHVNGARRKLGARNRAQAAARLVLCGLD
jgi:DNA-binding CsgD family transcriptional regulator